MAGFWRRERHAMGLTPMRGKIRTVQMQGLAYAAAGAEGAPLNAPPPSRPWLVLADGTALPEPHVQRWGAPARAAVLVFGVVLTWAPILLAVKSLASPV